MNELTPEQIAQLKKLYKQYTKKLAVTGILFTLFVLTGVFSVTLINLVWIKNLQFQTIMCFSTGFIALVGLQGTLREQHDILEAERNKIISPKQ